MAVAESALRVGVGPPTRDLTYSVWPNVYTTRGGLGIVAPWDEFVGWHRAAAHAVCPKGKGVVYSPTLNSDGHRCNASTKAMLALVLDCDGTGDWVPLLASLDRQGLTYLAHRSGGCSPRMPKWRVILPLAEPFDTESSDGVARWRLAYSQARTVFGAVARLSGPGFDPATDGPHHPWYPGYRRQVADVPREVIDRPGFSLDLIAMLAPLPSLLPPGSRHEPPAKPRRAAAAPPRTPPVCSSHDVPSGLVKVKSLLERVFESAGMAGKELGHGKRAVRCPWNDVHSDPLAAGAEPTSSTVLFPPTKRASHGAFYCSHASCGFRPVVDVIVALAPVIQSLAEARDPATIPVPVIPQSPSPPPRTLRMPKAGPGTPRGLPSGARALRRFP